MGNQSKTWIGRRAATLGLLATLIAGVGVGVGGCAVTMSEDEVKAVAATVTLPQLPAPGQAIVYVVRPLLEGFAIPTRVYLDEQTPAANVGYTLGNEHIWFNVSPGRHTIFSKADNWGIIAIDCHPGDVIFIEQVIGLSLPTIRNDLRLLTEHHGKFWLKHTQPGSMQSARP